MRRLPHVFLLLVVALAPACVRVAPWQRGHLAAPIMAAAQDPDEEVLEQHFLQAREGSTGGFGEAGGGCGCN